MKTFRHTLTVLLFVISITAGYSQSFQLGKLITNNGETLVGLISFNPDAKTYKECRFKSQKNAPVTTYSPENIQALVYDKGPRKYIQGRLPYESRSFFFKVLCEGKVNLLYQAKYDSAQFFVQKQGEAAIHSLPYRQMQRFVDNGYSRQLKTIETTYHIDTLKAVMKDAPGLFNDIENTKSPSQSNLIRLVSRYNSGQSSAVLTQEKKTPLASNPPELLRKGKINLYMQTAADDNKHFFIQKGEGTTLIELPFTRNENKQYQGMVIRSYSDYTTMHIDTLKKYMADASPLFASIEEIKTPSKGKLTKVIDEYNSYLDEATYTKKHALRRLPLNIDLIPGFYYSDSRYHVFDFGSMIDIGFISCNKHLFLKSGLFVFKTNTPLTDKYYSQGGDTLKAAARVYKIPLQLEYRFLERTIQPCLAIGYNYYVIKEDKPYNRALMPVVSPGINILMGNRFSARFNMEMEFNNAFKVSYVPESLQRINLFVGFQIKL